MIINAHEHPGANADRVLYAFEGVSPAIVQQADLDENTKQAVLYRNAARLLGLPAERS